MNPITESASTTPSTPTSKQISVIKQDDKKGGKGWNFANFGLNEY